MKPPCKNCEDRHQGCHAECESYAEYRDFCDKQRSRRHDVQLVNSYGFDRIAKAVKIREWQNK